MADVVGGRKADGKVVRDRILAELLVHQQRLGEVEGQRIAGGAQRQPGGEILVVGGPVWVRKGAPETGEVGLIVAVVGVAEQVVRRRAAQLPGLAGIGRGGVGCVPSQHPVGVAVVVIGAGDELAVGLGEPEGLAGMTRQRDRAAVLDRDAEDLGLAVGVHRQLVAEGRGQDGVRRASVHLGGALGGVDLRGLVDVGIGRQQMVVGVFDVVDQAPLFAVEPEVADHPMGRGHGAGGQRRVPDDGLGVGVLIVGVVVVDTLFHQVAEAAVTEHMGVAAG